MNENSKQVIVTTSWDDGHKMDIKLSRLLKKYNVKGTLYICPNSRKFRKQELLSNKEITDLSNDSDYIEIGSHTISHPRLSKIKSEEAYMEIMESKQYIEDLTKKDAKSFCYPYGDYNEKTKELVRKAGFQGARTVKQLFTKLPKDQYEVHTTVQAKQKNLNYLIRMALVRNIALIPRLLNKDWEEVAKKTFDYVCKHGGVYHLWGHSWEVDNENNWEKLERVLDYIGNNPNVKYMTNGEVFDIINNRSKR